MHPSFVPLEMKEFEEFVRDQRRKQNQLWLRKKEVDGNAFESRLCKFQGCVQPSQISHDGFCESHVIAAELVKEKDRSLPSPFIFFLYEQMKPIVLTEDDLLVPRNKDRMIGEAGLACKHCEGRRCFPNGG
jgi:hypothetical protein